MKNFIVGLIVGICASIGMAVGGFISILGDDAWDTADFGDEDF
jgi:hypothetical protein